MYNKAGPQTHPILPFTCGKAPGLAGMLGNHFQATRAKQFHHSEEGKAFFFPLFFNGEKWEAGEELAVAGPGN